MWPFYLKVLHNYHRQQGGNNQWLPSSKRSTTSSSSSDTSAILGTRSSANAQAHQFDLPLPPSRGRGRNHSQSTVSIGQGNRLIQCLSIFENTSFHARAYLHTGYSDTLLTVTVLASPMLPKSVTVSKYLLTVTPFSCPEDVTVTEYVCMKAKNMKNRSILDFLWDLEIVRDSEDLLPLASEGYGNFTGPSSYPSL